MFAPVKPPSTTILLRRNTHGMSLYTSITPTTARFVWTIGPLDTTQSDYRVDQVISSTQRFFARYSTRLNDDKATIFFPEDLKLAEGRINQEDHVHGAVADYTNTVTPTTVFSGRLGFARTLFVFANQGLGFVPSSLGLPKYIDTASDNLQFPSFSVTDYRGLGGGDHQRNAFMTYTGVANANKDARQAYVEGRYRHTHDARKRV